MLLILVISVLYIYTVDSVSSQCDLPLNSSNCGLRPKMVYTYYGPKAFCYPAIWRGCPTSNKFEHEHHCLINCTKNIVSNFVLGLKEMSSMPKSGSVEAGFHRLKIKPVKCDVPLNKSRCTEQMKQVFTFSHEKGACVADIWFGCASENIFTDISSCKHYCPNKELGRKEKLATEKCAVPLNTKRCGRQFKKLVYTYNVEERACVEAIWFGCPSNNIFTDISSCRKTCNKTLDEEMERKDTYEENQVSDSPKKTTEKTDPSKKGNIPVKIKPVNCDVPLNTSRCTHQMKQVFTFSNEKGACVADIWFGCPSENIFTDISSCQHNCPNKQLGRKEKLATGKCAVPLNTNRCGRQFKKLVYTYNVEERACVEAIWFGCPSNNIFTDISSCRKTCNKTLDEEMERKDTYEENQVSDSPKKTTEKTDPSKKGNIPVKIKPVKCDVPLNKSRCTEQMKQVFTFSHEKGACVADIWFGCPSENIFIDISSCQHNCPNKEQGRKEKLTTGKCAVPLNTNRCGRQFKKLVYTYNVEERACVEAIWFGCPSNNIFTDISSCRKTCNKTLDEEMERKDTYEENHVSDSPKKTTEKTDPSKKGNIPVKIKPVKCDVPLNTSRCTKQMKQVFTFSNEKGACVADIWFGCPSENIYTDILSCQYNCPNNWIKELDRMEKYLAKEKCAAPLDTKRCSRKIKPVYTYNTDKKACVKASWFGCPSINMFTDIVSCRKTCHKPWEQELEKMDTYAVDKDLDFPKKLAEKTDPLKKGDNVVEIEMCDTPLDTSRCSKVLKQVYTFNIEEQACVKAPWFGCPSKNVFTDIESCQKTCHKKLDDGLEEIEKSHKGEFSEIAKKLINNTDVTTKAKPKGCDALLNTNRCTKHMKQVYTYNNEKGACVRTLWFGCPSENLFVDISSCRRHCHVKVDKMATIAIPKNTGKFIDYNEKAYFMYKLEEANRGAGERFDDTDIMLIVQDKYNVL